MHFLETHGNQIVTTQGQPIALRGACVGGWMNMEEFINGYPGSEHGLREIMKQALGAEKGQFFFERMLDYFFNEDDVAYLKSLGSTVVRLPLNYRHFEDDQKPFQYLEAGFRRLDQALEWCGKHELYVILDMHAVQGWQNTDWHCDNSTRHTLFWQHPHFQDRFVALWEKFARRYRGNAAIAGYNVMNEPVTNAPYGRFSHQYQPNWEAINQLYRRVVTAIRQIDPEHIIFLEGDLFSSQFDGFEAPFAENLVYSSHNYNAGGFGPGAYPGMVGGERWDVEKQRQVFLNHSGTRYTQKYNVPLWVGEFGAAYNGPAEEIPDRLRAIDDQLGILNEYGAHWTMWTYKDIHVMGWVQLDPQSEYIQRIRHILEAKRSLATDFWMGWVAPTPAKQKLFELAHLIETALEDESIDANANRTFLAQAALSGYTAGLMQPVFARQFAGLSTADLERVMQSFALKNCQPHAALVDILKRRLRE
jgi:aryl-phospho-beta-D-glucosidase BglC (GH1 family)